MSQYGIGASLASMGAMQQREATEALAKSADMESRREDENRRLRAQAKGERRQLGSTLGAMGGFALGAQEGSVGGPWGALIGGVVGAVAGGLID